VRFPKIAIVKNTLKGVITWGLQGANPFCLCLQNKQNIQLILNDKHQINRNSMKNLFDSDFNEVYDITSDDRSSAKLQKAISTYWMILTKRGITS
jgi:hypothetical protein